MKLTENKTKTNEHFKNPRNSLESVKVGNNYNLWWKGFLENSKF